MSVSLCSVLCFALPLFFVLIVVVYCGLYTYSSWCFSTVFVLVTVLLVPSLQGSRGADQGC